jgi:hypothetical protein
VTHMGRRAIDGRGRKCDGWRKEGHGLLNRSVNDTFRNIIKKKSTLCYILGYIFSKVNSLGRLAPTADDAKVVTAAGGPVVGKRIRRLRANRLMAR